MYQYYKMTPQDFDTYAELVDALVHKLSNVYTTDPNVRNCYYFSPGYDDVVRSNLFGYKVVTINENMVTEVWNRFFSQPYAYGSTSVQLVYDYANVNQNYDDLSKHHFAIEFSKTLGKGIVFNRIAVMYQYDTTMPHNTDVETIWFREFITSLK